MRAKSTFLNVHFDVRKGYTHHQRNKSFPLKTKKYLTGVNFPLQQYGYKFFENSLKTENQNRPLVSLVFPHQKNRFVYKGSF